MTESELDDLFERLPTIYSRFMRKTVYEKVRRTDDSDPDVEAYGDDDFA